jgi:NAD(P)-dependent dehydrogenase (short-subunit alcohol dehydrogenase family)
MTSELFDLRGRVAVVTGGGRGIGRAIAEALAAHGARVVVCGRTVSDLDQSVRAIRARSGGTEPFLVIMDVTSDAEVARARDEILERAGGIDILVNNAGIDPHYAALERTSNQEWDDIVAVNLTGVFRCCRVLGGAMLERKPSGLSPRASGGAIVNVSSIAGHVGLKRQVPYCATKGGVEQLTRSLACDWAEHGIRVNAIAYGFIETDLTRAVLTHPHIGPRYLARIPMGRFGQLTDVAGAAVFLASPAASYVTGHSLVVDGGWTAS